MGRDDDLVGAEGPERIVHRLNRIRVADLAARLDPLGGQGAQRLLQPVMGERPGAVLVRGPVAERRVEGGADDEHVGVALRPAHDLAAQGAAGHGLVGDHENAASLAAPRGEHGMLGLLGLCLDVVRETGGEDEEDHECHPAAEEDARHRDDGEQSRAHEHEAEGLSFAPERVAHGAPPCAGLRR